MKNGCDYHWYMLKKWHYGQHNACINATITSCPNKADVQVKCDELKQFKPIKLATEFVNVVLGGIDKTSESHTERIKEVVVSESRCQAQWNPGFQCVKVNDHGGHHFSGPGTGIWWTNKNAKLSMGRMVCGNPHPKGIPPPWSLELGHEGNCESEVCGMIYPWDGKESVTLLVVSKLAAVIDEHPSEQRCESMYKYSLGNEWRCILDVGRVGTFCSFWCDEHSSFSSVEIEVNPQEISHIQTLEKPSELEPKPIKFREFL